MLEFTKQLTTHYQTLLFRVMSKSICRVLINFHHDQSKINHYPFSFPISCSNNRDQRERKPSVISIMTISSWLHSGEIKSETVEWRMTSMTIVDFFFGIPVTNCRTIFVLDPISQTKKAILRVLTVRIC